MRNERGAAIIIVLFAVGVAALLIPPGLTLLSSLLIQLNQSDQMAMHYYAADSGIEYAIVSLKNDPSLRGNITTSYKNNPNNTTSITMPSDPPNGITTTVTVRLLNPGQWSSTQGPSLQLAEGIRHGLTALWHKASLPLSLVWDSHSTAEAASTEIVPNSKGVQDNTGSLLANVQSQDATTYDVNNASAGNNIMHFNGFSTTGLPTQGDLIAAVLTIVYSTDGSYPVTASAVDYLQWGKGSQGQPNASTFVNTSILPSRTRAPTSYNTETYDLLANQGQVGGLSLSDIPYINIRFTNTSTGSDKVLHVDYIKIAVSAGEAGLYLTKTVSPYIQNPSAPITYTVKLTNSTSQTQTFSSISDQLPYGFTYITSSSRWNGTVTADPSISTANNVQTLTWSGLSPSSVPGNGTATLVFQANTGTAGGNLYNSASCVTTNYGTISTGDTAPVQVLGDATVNLTPTAGPNGWTIMVIGDGAAVNKEIVIKWDDQTVVATVWSSSKGDFQVQFDIPSDSTGTFGTHTITAQNTTGKIYKAAASLRVQAKYEIITTTSLQTIRARVSFTDAGVAGIRVYSWLNQ
ncbi:MAG: DUF11 domain-containing protein [Chloroflexi bacterium]|nr:DUF11 domain-containing protein [Chloroflexota bacterium]